MKAKIVVLIVIVSLIFFGIGLIVGAVSFYISTTTAGIVGANDCCGYVNYVLQAEADGELDLIPLGQFEEECSLRSGLMVSHQYDGLAYVEYRSFCNSLSVDVSVVYVTTREALGFPTTYSTLYPISVELARVWSPRESVLGGHSARRYIFDREKYELYLASLERD